jgi:hypothetical protein
MLSPANVRNDPLPASPFQAEGKLGLRWGLSVDAGLARPVKLAPPPPERGRLGGGQFSQIRFTTGAGQ